MTKVTRETAFAFIDKITGTELCEGAGADEAACYRISPAPRAFLEGAIGPTFVPEFMRRSTDAQRMALAEFFQQVALAIHPDPDQLMH